MSKKSLVIVESPAKARTINGYLGSEYIVEASVGHIKDLPKDDLAIDIEAGFKPSYVVIDGKQEVVDRLRQMAARCERVYIATDPDREGEAIAQHVAEEVRPANARIERVLFREITKTGVTEAMKRPRAIDDALVRAQEARRVMDRLIGYRVSPYLWRTFRGEQRGLSAGRVQSVALRLVAERERAIASFLPIVYWTLTGTFSTREGGEFDARLVRIDGRELRAPVGSAADPANRKLPEPLPWMGSRSEAEAILKRAKGASYAVESLETAETKRAAPPPFTTSTLQQAASRRLKLQPERTMKLAQQLYEGVDIPGRGRLGLVTYMRTDSTRISDEARDAAQEYILAEFGHEYTVGEGAEGARAKRKKGAAVQDAHEAIRPTTLALTPREARKHLSAELAGLYELIWQRFVASQMAPAIIDRTTVMVEGGGLAFRAVGRVTRFRGWMQVYTPDEESETLPVKRVRGKGGEKGEGEGEEDREGEVALPQNLTRGMPLKLERARIDERSTRPPFRYTESTLIREMETRGIGRPSTYASIVGTVQNRGYVEQHERKLHATEIGMKVSDALIAAFPKLFEVTFTASMEKELDTVASGSADMVAVLERFYRPLEQSLRQLGSGIPPRRVVSKGIHLKHATEGEIGEAKGTTVAEPKGGTPTAEPPAPVPQCPACEAPMRLRRTQSGGSFYGCSRYPECTGTRPVTTGVKCPKCGEGELVERTGGRYNAVFYGCSRYPECRYTVNTLEKGETPPAASPQRSAPPPAPAKRVRTVRRPG